MKLKHCLAAAVLSVAALVGAAATPALAAVSSPAVHSVVTPDAASPWYSVYLHAESGNGCVGIANGTTAISQQCSIAAQWSFRDLTRNIGGYGDNVEGGDKLEFVAADNDTLALKWSSSAGWIVTTPNDNSTYVNMNSYSNYWFLLIDGSNTAGMYPKGAGVQLGAPAYNVTTAPPDEWFPCPTSNPTCNPQIGTFV